jgi:hypothetical protein
MDNPAAPTARQSASYKTQLVRLIAGNGTLLFHAPDGHPYATVKISDHHETISLLGNTFAEYLSREYYNAKNKVVGSSDLKDAIRVLAASAKHHGPRHDVFIRIARVGDTIWLDLGREQWDAVKITRDGWSVVPTPEVKFRRSRGLLALPEPVRGTKSLTTMIKQVINITDPMLLIAWLLGSLRGRQPYPLLNVTGEQGSAKSSACRNLRRLIDPNTADLRLPPKEPRDVMIAAINSLIIAYDNLSTIPDWLSDALCVLSTGGGFGTRELYSDMDEALFSAHRPILLNGITDVVTRPDLLDRALVVTLDPIPDDKRKSESDLDAAFAAAHPYILAALLDAVVVALKNESTTVITELPRMADFATWVVAAESALGWEPGAFLAAYRANQQAAIENVLDGDVVVEAIKDLPELDAAGWTGQLKDLLLRIPENKYKPTSPRALRSALRRKAPALRRVGITMEFHRGHVKTVLIRRTGGAPVYTRSPEPEDDQHFADADDPAFVAQGATAWDM